MAKIKFKLLLHKLKAISFNGFHASHRSPSPPPLSPSSPTTNFCLSPLNHKALDIPFPASPKLSPPRPVLPPSRPINEASISIGCNYRAPLASSFRKAKENLQALGASMRYSDPSESRTHHKDARACKAITTKAEAESPFSSCFFPATQDHLDVGSSSFSSEDNFFTSEKARPSTSSNSSSELERSEAFSFGNAGMVPWNYDGYEVDMKREEHGVKFPWLSPESSSSSNSSNVVSIEDAEATSDGYKWQSPKMTRKKACSCRRRRSIEDLSQIKSASMKANSRTSSPSSSSSSSARRKPEEQSYGRSSAAAPPQVAAKPPRRGRLKRLPSSVKGKVTDSVAVVKCSKDPYIDFRDSMVDMILQKHMFESKDLEELLQCFLSLNSLEHHTTIVEAFTEVWEKVYGGNNAIVSRSNSKHM